MELRVAKRRSIVAGDAYRAIAAE
jgi:hypothetical protein